MSLTPEQLLYGYSIGVFPMSHADEGNSIYWYEPTLRGVLPLDQLKVSHSLRQTLKSGRFGMTMNACFEKVMRACAEREETWISEEIIVAYTQLHELGYAHSFEAWNKDGELVGGLYGVSLGRAFFGESMFHRERDASKVALFYLVDWLKQNGFLLLDTQYLTDHLKSLGGIEVPRSEYLELLKDALEVE